MTSLASGTGLFPLPAIEEPLPSSSRSRRVQRRRARAVELTQLANLCILSLNLLAFSFVSCYLSNSHDTSYLSSFSPSAAQLRLVSRVYDACADFFKRRQEAAPQAASSCDLPHEPLFGYSLSRLASKAVPLIADRVSLPDLTGATAVNLIDLLPPEAAALYLERACLRSSPSAMAFVRPPRFTRNCSQPEWVKLVQRLQSLGMVAFTAEPLVVNNVFGVPKDGDRVRLIVDARPANQVMIDPPPVSLPTPDLISKLQAIGPFVVAKVDLDNFYHRIRLPEWLQRYFALPPVAASDVGLAGFAPGTLVYPCCVTLPMGWSHSVYIAQTAHEYLLDTRTDLQRCDRITQTGDLTLDRPRHLVYIDDLILLAPVECSDRVTALQRSYCSTTASSGLPAKQSKLVLPTLDGVDCLGLEVVGASGVVRLSAAKFSRLIQDTRHLIAQEYASGLEVAHVLGKWVWASLAFRPALSCFSNAFRFVQAAGPRVFALWPSVRIELECIVGLAPLLSACVLADWFPEVVATDASQWGLGVVAARMPPAEFVSLSTGDPFEYDELGVASLVPLLRERRWRTIVSSPWSFTEHINVLELRAVSTALRWILSRPSSLCTRLVVLSDSKVVVGALTKGRSSSQELLRRCRTVSALLLASGVQLSVLWVPSTCNPADESSRRGSQL